MNILKKLTLMLIITSSIFFLSCSKNIHYSGISENSLNQVIKNYLSRDYTKEEVSKIIGSPLIQENSGDLWIFRIEKEKGNSTFKKTVYNKTLKFKFENNILRSVEEINFD